MDLWKHRQLTRAEIEKLKEEAQKAAQAMTEARKNIISQEKPRPKEKKSRS